MKAALHAPPSIGLGPFKPELPSLSASKPRSSRVTSSPAPAERLQPAICGPPSPGLRRASLNCPHKGLHAVVVASGSPEAGSIWVMDWQLTKRFSISLMGGVSGRRHNDSRNGRFSKTHSSQEKFHGFHAFSGSGGLRVTDVAETSCSLCPPKILSFNAAFPGGA